MTRLSGQAEPGNHYVRGETAAERKERHERGVQKGINARIEKVSKKCRP